MKEITIIAASDIQIKQTLKALQTSTKIIKPYKTILFSSHNYLKNLNDENIVLRKLNHCDQNQTTVIF